MGEFIYFTEEQKERANAVRILDILRRENEDVERSGNEWRWKRHKSVTFRGNSWYRHSQQTGSYAIDFVREFFGMSFPEAVTYLLNGETGQLIDTKDSVKEKKSEKKKLVIPKKNGDMKRVYAYLMKKRHINREVITYFVKEGTLYESADHHNIVFAGMDKEGNIRHIHKKGTNSDGKNFRINEEGSEPAFGFGHLGISNKLYVFEAPIDLLSFLTLYPGKWKENSYIVLNGVSEHALLRMLKDFPNLNEVILCLDHDAAGIEACGRLAEIVMCEGEYKVKRLYSYYKDWNEDLKNMSGEEAIPAEEHPKQAECRRWIDTLKGTVASLDRKYGDRGNICNYYQQMIKQLKNSPTLENLESAFDGMGMVLTGVLVKCIENELEEFGQSTNAEAVMENLYKQYRPYKDKGNLTTRIRKLQEAYEETMEAFQENKIKNKENVELLVKKCMSFSMKCIEAHIFVATDYQKQLETQGKEMKMECSQ